MYNIDIRRRYVFRFCIFGSVTSINIVSSGYRLGVKPKIHDILTPTLSRRTWACRWALEGTVWDWWGWPGSGFWMRTISQCAERVDTHSCSHVLNKELWALESETCVWSLPSLCASIPGMGHVRPWRTLGRAPDWWWSLPPKSDGGKDDCRYAYGSALAFINKKIETLYSIARTEIPYIELQYQHVNIKMLIFMQCTTIHMSCNTLYVVF